MRYRSTFILSAALMAAACGGGDDNTPTGPSNPPPGGGGNPPTATTTITITANGVSPQRITVSPGTRVTFVNSNNANHEMNSDPHPTHGECPEIDAVGFIAPGQTKLTGNLNTVRTCGFHDHQRPDVAAFRGEIVVQ